MAGAPEGARGHALHCAGAAGLDLLRRRRRWLLLGTPGLQQRGSQPTRGSAQVSQNLLNLSLINLNGAEHWFIYIYIYTPYMRLDKFCYSYFRLLQYILLVLR